MASSSIDINLMAGSWKTEYAKNGTSTTRIRGRIYQGDATPHVNELFGELPNDLPFSDGSLAPLVDLNGFFAFVREESTRVIAVVDRIRSIPLFYGRADSRVFLSDDAEWMRRKVGDTAMDPVAREEFQLTGYVTGAETLFPSVRQLQAGEVLVVDTAGVVPRVTTHRYYRFLHSEPAQFDSEALRSNLEVLLASIIRRLIDYADGRQIVVPLSGGYDSRLIATLLKRSGYTNVIAFTYGTPGNQESRTSRTVADALGLQWRFVEYSNRRWREAWKTDERWDYQKWASGWASIPLVQDWLAVRVLKQQAIIADDCVFVPGHTGDFISGGHIPNTATPGGQARLASLTEAIVNKHYRLAPIHHISRRPLSFWWERVLDRAESGPITRGEDLANFFEKWEWQERQAKFICNAVRVYEFSGYDWWLPLWDREFVEFWEQIPLPLRRGRKWFMGYIDNLYLGETGIKTNEDGRTVFLTGTESAPKLKLTAADLYVKAKCKIRHSPHSRDMLRFIQNARTFYRLRSLAIFGRYPLFSIYRLIWKGFTVNGINALRFLEEVVTRESSGT